MSNKGYIPSHQREGFDESKVDKLPNGWNGQRTDHWGNEKKPKNAAQRKNFNRWDRNSQL